MPFHIYENTWETSTTIGTAAYALGGAVSGWRPFSAQYADGDTTWYSAFDGINFEHGIGTYNSAANTLTRTTILRSTNGNAAINWAAGSKQITVAPLGTRLEVLSAGAEGQEFRVTGGAPSWFTRPYLLAQSGAVTLTSGLATKINLNIVPFDNRAWWDAANFRYVPKLPGKYDVLWETTLGDTSTGNSVTSAQAGIVRNGTTIFNPTISGNGTNKLGNINPLPAEYIVDCNGSTDYIETNALVNVASGGVAQLISGVLRITYLGP